MMNTGSKMSEETSPVKNTPTLIAALLLAPVAALHAAEPGSVTNSLAMKLVRIAPGTFTMGQDGPPMEDYGLFAAVSYDEGQTWPDRRLLAPEGKSIADSYGYLAATQTRDGRVQLITSKDHYTFNLAWIKALPPAPKR